MGCAAKGYADESRLFAHKLTNVFQLSFPNQNDKAVIVDFYRCSSSTLVEGTVNSISISYSVASFFSLNEIVGQELVFPFRLAKSFK